MVQTYVVICKLYNINNIFYIHILSAHYYHRHYHHKSFLAMERLYLVQKCSLSHYQPNYKHAQDPELPRDSLTC